MKEINLSSMALVSASGPDARGMWSDFGYAALDQVITEADAHQIGLELFLLSTMGHMARRDSQSDRYWLYNGARGDELLNLCESLVVQLVGAEVLPTYSYSVVYEPGSDLPAHRDRHACEVSMTIPLAAIDSAPDPQALLREQQEFGSSRLDWPLHLETPTGVRVDASFAPGSAVVYKGLELLHSRDTLVGARAVAVFLHYVLRHGPYADHANDARPPCCSGYGSRSG
jgi:hypothetical protein